MLEQLPELAWPWFLLLLPAPWIVARLLPAVRVPDDALLAPQLADAAREPGVGSARDGNRVSGKSANKTRLRFTTALAWFLLVLAACGPQWHGEPVALTAAGRDLLLAVDVSGSMSTEDMPLKDGPADRLSTVKKLGGEFLARREGDRVGLLLFGSNAYLVAPLTADRQAVQSQLQEAMIGIAGGQTAIGDAIGLAWKRLKDMPGERKVLILVTDGANTAGAITPAEAVEKIADPSLRIYTIGVGADEMEVPGGFFGSTTVNPSTDLDETLLQDIATKTGGRYFRARDPADFARIYAEIDRIEPVPGKQATVQPVKVLFAWPLALALLLVVLPRLWAEIRRWLQR